MAVAGAVALGALLKSSTFSSRRHSVNRGEGNSSAARDDEDARGGGGDDREGHRPNDEGKDEKAKWSSRKRMVKVMVVRQGRVESL